MGGAVEHTQPMLKRKDDAPCWGDRRPRGSTLFLISVGLNTWASMIIAMGSAGNSSAAASEWRRQDDPKPAMIKSPSSMREPADTSPDQTAAAFALGQCTAWSAGHFTFGATPGGDAETEADQQCRGAADATPRPRMVWQHQCGDQSQV
jgi:hypothetical protein